MAAGCAGAQASRRSLQDDVGRQAVIDCGVYQPPIERPVCLPVHAGTSVSRRGCVEKRGCGQEDEAKKAGRKTDKSGPTGPLYEIRTGGRLGGCA